MSSPALMVDQVSYAYQAHKPVLKDIGFEVAPGQFTALLGPNGAGKTTLMALITRLFHSHTGKIRLCGHDLHSDSRQALAMMGVVFQRPTLDLDMSVWQNCLYAARLYGLPHQGSVSRINALLERLGLEDHRHQATRLLSGGMRRRVELVRALIHAPKLLVLDEPTVGLDMPSRQLIVDHVHDLCRSENMAALWTTHLIDEIRPDDHLLVLAQGTIQAHGTTGDIMTRSGTDTLLAAYQLLTRTGEA